MRSHSNELGRRGRHHRGEMHMEMKRQHHEESPELGERRKGGRGGHGGRGRGGAQTFRRGRAIEFFKHLESKQQTLKQQLESKELESIQSIIAGELKATQAIMAEFKVAFDLFEDQEAEISEKLDSNNEEISEK